MSENNRRSKLPSIVVKAKNSDLAAITNNPGTALWLMDHVGNGIKPKDKVLVTNKATGFGTNVDPETAAFFLGLSVNKSHPGGKCVVWENHQLWFVDEERVLICSTRVPAPKSMYAFLRVAASMAGVDAADLARMFPPEKQTILVFGAIPDVEESQPDPITE